MASNSSPKRGDVYLKFNGRNAYVEIPSRVDYSASTTSELTIAVWMRPDTINFPHVEIQSDYIHWLGKGELTGATGNQEWTFRMYNHSDPLDNPPRPNRISFYLFNPQGGLGVGSFVQVPIHKGQWLHQVGVADCSRTLFYKDGQYIRCDSKSQIGCDQKWRIA
jgi:hypothetical protein